tara:strand:+ start:59831 stop:60532 length:702 start_codon:yes stop_codon:yes gene_type:complete
MDEKTKLYVFAKKEVALIFIFMILISSTAFVFGFKLGKGYTFTDQGFMPIDRQNVDILSKEEESVQKITDQNKEGKLEVNQEDFQKRLEERINQELNQEGGAVKAPVEESAAPQEKKNEPVSETRPIEPATSLNDQAPSDNDQNTSLTSSDTYSGKYTIQLGSHRSLKEAEEFAAGFKYRGYIPIINEVDIPGRGVWYRVSLGVFGTITEAKEYVAKENSLFQGQDYVLVRFE